MVEKVHEQIAQKWNGCEKRNSHIDLFRAASVFPGRHKTEAAQKSSGTVSQM